MIKLKKDVLFDEINGIFVFVNDWVKVVLNECEVLMCDLLLVKIIGMLMVLVGCLCKFVMGGEYLLVFMVGD